MHKMLSLPQSSKGERSNGQQLHIGMSRLSLHMGTGEIAAGTFFSFTLTDNLRSPRTDKNSELGGSRTEQDKVKEKAGFTSCCRSQLCDKLCF